jgi:hypothetical protein
MWICGEYFGHATRLEGCPYDFSIGEDGGYAQEMPEISGTVITEIAEEALEVGCQVVESEKSSHRKISSSAK